eukprot:5315209-Alexandrium_andersonii.AAC.1
MSASLVGSEMCIRDRTLPPHAERGTSCLDRNPLAIPSELPRNPLEAPSVSYTHLTLPTICSV